MWNNLGFTQPNPAGPTLKDLSEFKPLIKLEIEKYLQGVSGV